MLTMALIIQNPAVFSMKLSASLGLLHYSPKMVSSSSSFFSVRCYSAVSQRPLRCAVLGAGFAGLSVVWHLLQQSSEELNLRIDIYDEVGIGGGASGMSGGLLHPYSPKVKLLWRGEECWKESLKLLNIAEDARSLDMGKPETVAKEGDFIVRRSGIVRPALSVKNMDVMNDNAQNCIASCRIESIHKDAAQKLVPGLCVPLDLAFHMREAVNVHPQNYLEALYLACRTFVESKCSSGISCKELYLHKKSVHNLQELAGEYDAVIVCVGARAAFLPEFSGRLPLRTCRGVIAHLQLPDHIREEYPEHSPSILSDAWLAVQGPRTLYLGSTWEWKSRNYSRHVPEEEASKALEELLPKASAVYPAIKDWTITGACAGLRAMPPLTAEGSLPLLGCVDEFIGGPRECKYWLFTGLGSRGLFYHAWLGKLIARSVLSCNEDLIPSELTSWKHRVKQ
ncbi:PREDICTED: uncharacterized protein LOC109234473 isoform X2 [Nicotiana attenuata]|uniref:uncharacterized protein LOC109234473 isoform X2 n=1 Tax=Nicotiana attenuata TaxID=49451 RepID=UPI000905A9BA|nr:PREDICTED: uncharacterized protein LOC109234473 isoform X2 [Nicotiana attenuata]